MAVTVKKSSNTEDLLLDALIEGIQELKGKGLIKINLSKLNHSVFDYFLVCHGDSTTHVSAIADSIERIAFKKLNERPLHVEGTANAQWILVDYGYILVHVFQEEYRRFYQLEDLWSDAEIEPISDTPPASKKAVKSKEEMIKPTNVKTSTAKEKPIKAKITKETKTAKAPVKAVKKPIKKK